MCLYLLSEICYFLRQPQISDISEPCLWQLSKKPNRSITVSLCCGLDLILWASFTILRTSLLFEDTFFLNQKHLVNFNFSLIILQIFVLNIA